MNIINDEYDYKRNANKFIPAKFLSCMYVCFYSWGDFSFTTAVNNYGIIVIIYNKNTGQPLHLESFAFLGLQAPTCQKFQALLVTVKSQVAQLACANAFVPAGDACAELMMAQTFTVFMERSRYSLQLLLLIGIDTGLSDSFIYIVPYIILT